MAISRETITQLAPAIIDNDRSSRYRADDQAVALDELSAADRELVVWLYGYLRELDSIVDGDATDAAAPLLEFLARHEVSKALERVRRIGIDVVDPHLAAVCHDVRGGALSVLFVHLSRLTRIPYRSEFARSLFIVARDHLKMMRNVVRDLDSPARENDLELREHHLGDLASALQQFTAPFGAHHITVDVDCPADAIIAESCVECGAIDRVAYNLLNNAARHASEPRIGAWLIRFDKNLRIAVANSVEDAHRAILAERVQTNPASLFGGFTTTGSGYGLRIVSELVGAAYGIASVDRLTKSGHIGATLIEDRFVAWFHWPLSDGK